MPSLPWYISGDMSVLLCKYEALSKHRSRKVSHRRYDFPSLPSYLKNLHSGFCQVDDRPRPFPAFPRVTAAAAEFGFLGII